MLFRKIINRNLSKTIETCPVERTANILVASGLLGGIAGASYASYKGISKLVESTPSDKKISHGLAAIPLAPLYLFFGGTIGSHIGVGVGVVAAIARAMPKTSIAVVGSGALAAIAPTLLKPK